MAQAKTYYITRFGNIDSQETDIKQVEAKMHANVREVLGTDFKLKNAVLIKNGPSDITSTLLLTKKQIKVWKKFIEGTLKDYSCEVQPWDDVAESTAAKAILALNLHKIRAGVLQ